MQAFRLRRAHCRRVLVLLASCAIASGCVSSDDPAVGALVAVFRGPPHPMSEAVAPGLQTAWYQRREPVRYAKVGLATWSEPPSEWRFAVWISHLFGRNSARPEPPIALGALDSGLPTPSIVTVTDLATYRTITVRVDQKAVLPGLIELPSELAEALGAAPDKPLRVRVRYAGPVLAYRAPPTLGQVLVLALRGPAGPPAVALAAETTAAPAATARPTTPEVIATAPAPPQAIQPDPARLILAALRPELPPPPIEASDRSFGVQAGAFASLANARRAVSLLAVTGRASIIPARGRGFVIYRVVLEGPVTAEAAEALRARVARTGFPDAQVLAPL
jgi:hypothetical protein